jgi:hypothetical protein
MALPHMLMVVVGRWHSIRGDAYQVPTWHIDVSSIAETHKIEAGNGKHRGRLIPALPFFKPIVR